MNYEFYETYLTKFKLDITRGGAHIKIKKRNVVNLFCRFPLSLVDGTLSTVKTAKTVKKLLTYIKKCNIM